MSDRPPHREAWARARAAESWVSERLEEDGWRLLGRNLRTPHGEIDLLARAPGGILVAVEVKARHPLSWARGEDALRPAQRRRLARALEWCAQRVAPGAPRRIDLADVVWIDGQVQSWERCEGVDA